jgi:hypothetical protein
MTHLLVSWRWLKALRDHATENLQRSLALLLRKNLSEAPLI